MRATIFISLLTLLLCPPAYSQRKGRGVDTFRQFVTRLPPVDRIEVLAASPFLTEDPESVDCTSESLRCKPGSLPLKIDSSQTLTGADADRLAALWRKLHRDYLHEVDTCFHADHILRFYQGDHLLLETEVCVYCKKITLPNLGMVHVEGGLDVTYYDFQDFFLPDSRRVQRLEDFKREMMPKVGQRLTVIGLVGGGKPALAVALNEGHIYIHRMDVSEANYLDNLGCAVVIKVTGTLKHYEPEPQKDDGPVAQQIPPEHFYFDDADIKVVKVYPWTNSKRWKRRR